jgi:hypothetical protein
MVGFSVQQVRFVDHQQQGSLRPLGRLIDLVEQPILSASRYFTHLCHQHLQEAGGREMREVAVDGFAALRKFVQKALQQRRLAHPTGTGHQAQGGVVNQERQPRQCFLHPLVDPQGVRRSMFRKGLPFEFEMFLVHQEFLPSSRFCK